MVQNLPGTLIASPWSSAAVSAHVNAAAVATYLRTVLKRNNIDNKGGRVISSVNCVVKTDETPPGSNAWLNAFWNGTQMIYGQAMFDDRLRSLASSLDIVAQSCSTASPAASARLIYQDEPGTLNESYRTYSARSDLQCRRSRTSRKWNWQIGDAPLDRPAGVPATCQIRLCSASRS